MKVQIIYSSLTGCTRRVAEAIYSGLDCEKSIHDLKDGAPALDGDVVLFGYWGIGGHPNDEMKQFMENVSGKAVGVFCTLGYYADSAHAWDTVASGVELVKDRNQVIGSYVCNGAISKELRSGQGIEEGHIPTEQKEIRWEITDSHPTPAECALAAERFRERVYLYERCRELNIPFSPVL